jgi:SAM-dependent methyltransferase
MDDIEIIRPLLEDKRWLLRTQRYSGMDEEAFSDLLGAFFADRSFEGAPIQPPRWAKDLEGSALLRKQNEIIERYGWDRDMSLLGIVHLEDQAWGRGKEVLLLPFMEALRNTIQRNPSPHILDLGCGMSSFGQMALEHSDATCVFADLDPETLNYLQRICEERWPGRAQTLPLVGASLCKRTRARIDYRQLRGPFDVIIASDVLEHTLDTLSILVELYEQLSEGGFFFVNYPHYMEGDWHTPEAFYLYPWCMRFLFRTCVYERDFVWRKEFTSTRIRLIHLAAKLATPVFEARARAFARRYFREHGAEIVKVVAERSHRHITVDGLLESV